MSSAAERRPSMTKRGDSASGAIFSECMVYRYRLWRMWNDHEGRVVFVMLNPSTADETKLDPTMTRCVRRAKAMGFGACEVVNLFAVRATDPRLLTMAGDQIGPDNDGAIEDACDRADKVIVAWGEPKWPFVAERAHAVANLLRHLDHDLYALATTKAGWPRHPLYLRNDIKLAKWVSP